MVSKKLQYALKALVSLGYDYPSQPHQQISLIAKKERLPKKFLELILLDLKNAGFVESKMGKGGGYFLAKHPNQISLGAVMRTIDGPLSPLPCLSQTAYKKCQECLDEHTCAIRQTMKEVRDATVNILDHTTIQDMLDKSKISKEAFVYSI